MPGAVKAHVFHKVGQPLLIIGFKHRSYFVYQVHHYPILRLFVMTDVIGKAIRQFSGSYSRIKWQYAIVCLFSSLSNYPIGTTYGEH